MLDATVLGGLIKIQILAIETNPILNTIELTNFCNAIATAVVTHITTAGVVNPGIPVTGSLGAGVTSGPGTIS